MTKVDTTGTVNDAWKKHIPRYPDGTYSESNAGFVNTGHGTSCASCRFNNGGTCSLLEHGRKKVEETACCNFWTARGGGRIEGVEAAVNFITNKHIFKFTEPHPKEEKIL